MSLIKGKKMYSKTADLLRSGWERAANHEQLTFEETNALCFAFETFDKIVQIGETLQDILDDTETN